MQRIWRDVLIFPDFALGLKHLNISITKIWEKHGKMSQAIVPLAVVQYEENYASDSQPKVLFNEERAIFDRFIITLPQFIHENIS